MATREPAPDDAATTTEAPGAPRYLSFYGLEAAPFRATAAPDALWLAPAHEATLDTLTAAIRDGHGLFLLTGDVGTGKTSLVKRLSEMLGQSGVRVGHVCRPGLDPADFGEAVLAAFDVPADAHTGEEVADAIRDLLDRPVAANATGALLIVDEAQGLSPRLIEDIGALAARPRLSVLLVGHTDLAVRLSREPSAPAVRTACALPALSADEVASYIRHALAVAGSTDEVFSATAIREIASLSRGAPGAINIIGDRALLMGEARRTRPIHRGIVQDCCRTPASLTMEPTARRREPRPVTLIASGWSTVDPYGRRRVVLVVALLIGILATGAQLSTPSWLTWPWHDALDEPAVPSSGGSATGPAPGDRVRPSPSASVDPSAGTQTTELRAAASPTPIPAPPPGLRVRRPALPEPSTIASTPDPAEAVRALPARPVASAPNLRRETPARSLPREALSAQSSDAPPSPRTPLREAERPGDGPDPSAVIDWLVRQSGSSARPPR